MVTEAIEAYAASYGETILYSSARNRHLIGRMARILKRTVLTLQRQLVLQHGSVQRPCHHTGQRRITVAVKCRPDQLIQRIPILLPVRSV